MPWRCASPDHGAVPAAHAGVVRIAYAIRLALYRIFGSAFANLTSSRPVLSKRPHAQVAELVDALASGASGLTAVKVRVLSWAPLARTPDQQTGRADLASARHLSTTSGVSLFAARLRRYRGGRPGRG